MNRSQTALLDSTSGDPVIVSVNDDQGKPGISQGPTTFMRWPTLTSVAFGLNESFTVGFRTIVRDQEYMAWWANVVGTVGGELIQPGFSVSFSSPLFGFLIYWSDASANVILAQDISAFISDNTWVEFVVVYNGDLYEAGSGVPADLVKLYIDGVEVPLEILNGSTFPEDPDATKGSAPVSVGFDPFVADDTLGGVTVSQMYVCAGAHPPTVVGVFDDEGGDVGGRLGQAKSSTFLALESKPKWRSK